MSTSIFASSEVNLNDELQTYIEKNMVTKSYNADNAIYTVTIDDANELEKIHNGSNDKLISRTITYIILKEEDTFKEETNISKNLTRWGDDWTIGGWEYISNRWYTESEGTPYRVEGAADMTVKITTESSYQLFGEGSGKVKGIVEIKIGGKIDEKKKTEWSIHVQVDDGYYRDLEVWEYKSRYDFNIYKNDELYATDGIAYKPNGGKKLTNDLYKKSENK